MTTGPSEIRVYNRLGARIATVDPVTLVRTDMRGRFVCSHRDDGAWRMKQTWRPLDADTAQERQPQEAPVQEVAPAAVAPAPKADAKGDAWRGGVPGLSRREAAQDGLTTTAWDADADPGLLAPKHRRPRYSR